MLFRKVVQNIQRLKIRSNKGDAGAAAVGTDNIPLKPQELLSPWRGNGTTNLVCRAGREEKYLGLPSLASSVKGQKHSARAKISNFDRAAPAHSLQLNGMAHNHALFH